MGKRKTENNERNRGWGESHTNRRAERKRNSPECKILKKKACEKKSSEGRPGGRRARKIKLNEA